MYIENRTDNQAEMVRFLAKLIDSGGFSQLTIGMESGWLHVLAVSTDEADGVQDAQELASPILAA